MKLDMELEGLDDLMKSFDRLAEAGVKERRDALGASAEKVRGDAIQSIHGGIKTGVTYKRGPNSNLSAQHTASARGQAPATDTGALANSIRTHTATDYATVGSELKYAFYLEHGTKNMAPRPYLAPALKENQEWITRRLAVAYARAAKRFNQ